MISRSRCAALLLLLAPLAALAGTTQVPLSEHDLGFLVGTRDEVLSMCKRVGLVPFVGPMVSGGDPDVYARVEPVVAKALADAGFDVVDAQPYRTAYERFAKAVGGVYDPMNGTLRKDAYAGVYGNAMREFISQGQLGCVAMVRGMDVKARLSGSTVDWDGAREYIDGEQKGGFARFWSGGAGNGEMGAISLLVQLMNREGKVVYGRFGGVQLAGYFNHEHGQEDGILSVPRDKLLMDDKRIERAVRHATTPLRYTPAEIALGAKDPALNTYLVDPNSLAPPPPGTHRTRPSGLLVPREQILSSVHRVLLGSLLASGFSPPPEATAQIHTLVREKLEKLGWDVVESDTMDAAFGGAVQKSGGLFDPFTGKQDDAKIRLAMHAAIESLGKGPAPDAVMWISLAKTKANQRFGNATWDGVDQSALTLGPVVKKTGLFGGSGDGTAGESTITAASLSIALRDADGKVIYNQRGGIQLVQQLSIKAERSYPNINYTQQFADLAPSELFRDAARIEHAVELATRELVLSPEQIAAEEQAAAPPAKH